MEILKFNTPDLAFIFLNDQPGEQAFNFAILHVLEQLMQHSNRIPDYFSGPVSWSNGLISTTGSKAYVTGDERPQLRAAIACAPTLSYYLYQDPQKRRCFWHYASAKWNNLRRYYSDFPWNDYCFRVRDLSLCAERIMEIIVSGMEDTHFLFPQSSQTLVQLSLFSCYL